MKSIKTILLGTTLAAGLGLFLGTDANAESLYTVKAGDTASLYRNDFTYFIIEWPAVGEYLVTIYY